MLTVVQGMQHAEPRRLANAGGDQRDRRFRLGLKKKVAVWRGNINHIAFLCLLMQIVGYLTLIFTLARDAIKIAVWRGGQRVLADFLVLQAVVLDVDCRILAWFEVNHLAAIDQC